MPGIKEEELFQRYVDYFNDYLIEDTQGIVGTFVKKDAVDILAQISVLFSSLTHFNVIMEKLENDLKALIDKKKQELDASQQPDPSFPKILSFNKDTKFLGLSWPFPTDELTRHKFYGLLNQCLLEKEKQNGINLPEEDSLEPFHLPAKFVGFVDKKQAEDYLRKSRTWREEMRMAPLLFHGKDAHRIQLVAIMYAIEMGIIKLPENTSIKNIIDLLLSTQTKSELPIWDRVLDTVVVGKNPHMDENHPLIKGKTRKEIDELISQQKQAIFMDPYFLHNYLLNDPEKRFPNISSSLISTFAKSTVKINEFENLIHFQTKTGFRNPELIYKDAITMKETLESQAEFYNTGGLHPINPLTIAAYYHEKGYLKEPLEIKVKQQRHINQIAPDNYSSHGYAFSNAEGFIFYKPKKSQPKDTKDKSLYQKSMIHIEREDMYRGMNSPLFAFFLEHNIATGDELSGKTLPELYKMLRDRLTEDYNALLKPHSDESLKNMSEDQIKDSLMAIINDLNNIMTLREPLKPAAPLFISIPSKIKP